MRYRYDPDAPTAFSTPKSRDFSIVAVYVVSPITAPPTTIPSATSTATTGRNPVSTVLATFPANSSLVSACERGTAASAAAFTAATSAPGAVLIR